MKLKFQLLNANAKLPSFAHEDDAAFDIYSSESVILKKKEFKAIETGIASEIPVGFYVSFEGRSGLAVRNGIAVLGGIIDAGYRGEWKVILINLGSENLKIEKGDRIAQGIIHKLEKVKISESKSLSSSERGINGFGSTGKK
ncbi:MAG TPA: dUTP diphosphatase [Alphaproteobacteria bacterium]|jgi:dUTP pyrophosphatase|nr:dUTP diphosphatase [Alphaproteobacteria bacterium]